MNMAEAMEDAMDVKAYLDTDDIDAPLHFLRYSCVERISFYLNKRVEPKRGMRYTPNFGGLAELIGFDGLEIGEMRGRENPALAVIDRWKDQLDLHPTVGNLVRYLLQLGREDILTDTVDVIREEIKFHKEKQKNNNLVQCGTVSSSSNSRDPDQILTIDDVMGGPTIYDAFLCYDANDLEFVKLLLSRLENPRFGFRLFVPGRNNLPCTYDHDRTSRIISERCRHMIVVISKSFIQSEACEFQAAYAFALNPGARDKKIIPVKIEACPTPGILQIMATCDFYGGNQDWSWRRLIISLLSPMNNNREFLGPQRFSPPTGSALGDIRMGMPELGIRPSCQASISSDSGFSSGSSGCRNQVLTAPLPSRPPAAGPSRLGHTAPVLAQEQPERDKNPGPVSQVFKKLAQPFYSSSKNQKKKSKSTDKASDKKTEDEHMEEDASGV